MVARNRLIASRHSVNELNALGGGRVRLHGLECEIVTDIEAEGASVVVCIAVTRPLTFPDNQTGPCVDCGVLLQWRPHAPKRPPRICLPCVTARAAEGNL
jgi:hypothetical protein